MKTLCIVTLGLVSLIACNDSDRSKTVNAAERKPYPADTAQTDADVTLTLKIRKVLEDDSSLSIDARNAKVAAKNGAVTLTGSVNDMAEKNAVESDVMKVAGVKSVDNKLSVKNP